jgi:hypothetical protein
MLPTNVDFDTGGIWNCEIYYVNMHDFIDRLYNDITIIIYYVTLYYIILYDR